MNVTGITKGRTFKRVTVHHGTATDDQIAMFAMDAANETRSSLFGWTVNRFDDYTTVDLYTD